ncbi:MAG: acyltransferase [Muribaculaceae bacterium]|nr:acyltransferase [Muribaculaceae bacterium]
MEILKGDKLLGKAQCQVLRGIAILGIFLHNFCHLMRGSNEENEFEFITERANNMWNYWTTGVDVFAPIQLFAFFGHYGVPIFLFLSGYGLVMKYERGDVSSHVGIWLFLGSHWLKLFKLMVLGFVLTVITFLACGLQWHGIFEYLAQATMLSNVVPSLCDSHTPSPYWFFGVMVEVYVIYRFLIYPFHDKRQSVWRWLMPLLLIVLAWLPQVMMEHHRNMLIYVRHNAAIAMLPFALGVLVARYSFPKLPRWSLAVVAVVALPMLALFSLNYQLWLWVPVLVIAGSVAFVKLLEPCKGLCHTIVISPLHYLGMLSAMFFVVHSIPRMPIYVFVLKAHSGLMLIDYAWLALYFVLTLALAWGYKKCIKHIS